MIEVSKHKLTDLRNVIKPVKFKKVIMFCGFQGSGKDYNADKFVNEFGYRKVAFANPLKSVLASTLGLTLEDFLAKGDDFKNQEIYNGKTVRDMLNALGENIKKNDKMYWVKALIKTIEDSDKNIAVSDLRFGFEYKAVLNFCKLHDIECKAVFCDYHSYRYKQTEHVSDKLASYLKNTLHYNAGENVDEQVLLTYAELEK